MLDRLLGPFSKTETCFAPPAGTRVYAIGDIHGRVDLLDTVHGLIRADIGRGAPDRIVVVYLGDYVDRGSCSREVIDLLISAPIPDAQSVHIRGNHEDIMLRFLEEPEIGGRWLINGGDTTLSSYGVPVPYGADAGIEMPRARAALRRSLPGAHLRFLSRLAPYHVEGGYVFVHAGIRPGVAIEDQDPRDLMWIRHEFLSSRADHGCRVVHGHTITAQPEMRSNRIGIDTGAFYSGVLTCLILEGAEIRWLRT